MDHGTNYFTTVIDAKALHTAYKYLNTLDSTRTKRIKLTVLSEMIGISRPSIQNYLLQGKITPLFGFIFIETIKHHDLPTSELPTALEVYNKIAGTNFKSWDELQKKVLDLSKL